MSEVTILFDDNIFNSNLYSSNYNKYLQKIYYNVINNIVIALSNYYTKININFINSPRVKLRNKVLNKFDISKYIIDYNSNLSLYDSYCNIGNNENKKIIVYTHNYKNLDLLMDIKSIKIIYMDLRNLEIAPFNTYSMILETLTPKKALHYKSTIEYFVETQLAEILI